MASEGPPESMGHIGKPDDIAPSSCLSHIVRFPLDQRQVHDATGALIDRLRIFEPSQTMRCLPRAQTALGRALRILHISTPIIQTTMSTLTTKDGTQIYYKDWESGQPIVFSHGWPLTSDSWEAQMFFLASEGYRCIAHDRRGHGRSSQPWDGNEMDTYADDLAELMNTLDLTNAVLIGFSTGGGEVTRYIGRHGSKRVAKLVLVGAVPPLMLKTQANPGGLPIDVFDGLRAGSIAALQKSQAMAGSLHSITPVDGETVFQ